MVIFPVYVAGYCTADSNKFRSGRYREKPSPGNNYFEDLIKDESALSFKNPGCRIKRKDLIVF